MLVSDGKSFLETIADMVARFKAAQDKPLSCADVVRTMTQDVSALIEDARTNALDTLKKTSKVMPKFVLMADSGMITQIVFDNLPEDDKDRAFVASGLSFVLKTASISAYTFMCEIWLAFGNGSVDPMLPPSKRDDRMEGVLVRIATPIHSEIVVFEIIRNSRGKVIDLKVMEKISDLEPLLKAEYFNILMSNLYTLIRHEEPNNSGKPS